MPKQIQCTKDEVPYIISLKIFVDSQPQGPARQKQRPPASLLQTKPLSVRVLQLSKSKGLEKVLLHYQALPIQP